MPGGISQVEEQRQEEPKQPSGFAFRSEIKESELVKFVWQNNKEKKLHEERALNIYKVSLLNHWLNIDLYMQRMKL